MFKVLSVKEYNYKMRNKWEDDVNHARLNHGHFPNLIMYLYQKDTGFVAFNETESQWFSKKSQAIEYVKKLTKEQTNE